MVCKALGLIEMGPHEATQVELQGELPALSVDLNGLGELESFS